MNLNRWKARQVSAGRWTLTYDLPKQDVQNLEPCAYFVLRHMLLVKRSSISLRVPRALSLVVPSLSK